MIFFLFLMYNKCILLKTKKKTTNMLDFFFNICIHLTKPRDCFETSIHFEFTFDAQQIRSICNDLVFDMQPYRIQHS